MLFGSTERQKQHSAVHCTECNNFRPWQIFQPNRLGTGLSTNSLEATDRQTSAHGMRETVGRCFLLLPRDQSRFRVAHPDFAGSRWPSALRQRTTSALFAGLIELDAP